MKNNKYFRNLALSLPFLALSLLTYVWIAEYLNISLDLKLMALGALGWWLALLLRLPIILILKKFDHKTAQKYIILSSGPTEEAVRLTLLVVLGLTSANAYSIGIGWAAIEILYSIIQSVGIGILQGKNDPKAAEAKAMLKTMGMDKAMEPTAPFWGILERISANALHLTFSLALVISPWLVLATAPLHSLMNYMLTKMVKVSISRAELVLFGISMVLFFWVIASI